MDDAETRRAQPRHDAPEDWAARYRCDASPGLGWRDARLIDVSERGAALEPFGLGDDELPAGMLDLVLVAPGGNPHGISLRGEIRHATRTSLGRVRLGVELVGISPNEAQLLELLFRALDDT